MITDVFFDLDHTLWDFEANAEMAYAQCFEEIHIPLDIKKFMDMYRPVNHDYWKMYREGEVSKEELQYGRLATSFDKLNHPVSDAQIESLIVLFLKYLPTYSRLFDGADEVLENFSKKYKLHIITNGFDEVQVPKLHNAGIEKYFHSVLTAEQAGVKKPDPQIFELALQRAGTKAENSLMVGDNYEADVQGAQQIGMKAVFFDPYDLFPGIHRPTIRHLSELLELF